MVIAAMLPGRPLRALAISALLCATRLAMARCTLPMIAAITGHSPEHITSVIKHYLALNSAIADEAIRLLSDWLERSEIAI